MQVKPLVVIVTKTEPYHCAVLEGFEYERNLLNQTNSFDLLVITLDRFDFASVNVKIQEAITKNPTVMITIGLICTQAMMHAYNSQDIKTPFIFCGVTNLHDAGLENMLIDQSRVITGISLGHPSYLTIARTLLWMKPEVKNVLLPYSPVREGGLLTSAAHLIKEFLHSRGVAVSLLPLSQGIDVLTAIRERILLADTLLSLEGCLVDEYFQDLIVLCNANKVTYFASSLSAVTAGAAIGLVNNPKLVGMHALRKCLQVISDHYLEGRGRILLLKNEGRRMAFNFEACRLQGICLSEEKLYLLKNFDVFGDFYQLIDSEE